MKPPSPWMTTVFSPVATAAPIASGRPGPIAADVVDSDVRGLSTGNRRLPQMYAGTVASLTMLPWRGRRLRIASMMR
jgi:hypothetical protein